MSTSSKSPTEEIIALLNDFNELSLSVIQMKQARQLRELVLDIQQNIQSHYPDRSISVQSEEVNESIDQYSKVDLNEDFRYRIQALDLFASLQRDRKKLFKRHSIQQEKNLLAKITEIQKEYSTNQQSFQTHKSSSKMKRREKEGRYSKKQISFKGNSSKTQKIVFLAQDISKLEPGCDLNDNIIENYLKILKHFFLPSWVSSKVHIFSTFFFTKLIGFNDPQEYFQGNSKKDIDRIKQCVRENYVNIKRWTKNLDIYAKQIIIFPINAFRHWFCIIVLNLSNINGERQMNESTQIIYCDSMFEKKQIIIQAIRQYLWLQLLDKKGKCIKKIVQNIKSYQLLLPRQLNTHDCGLYMLTYIDQLLARPQHLKRLAFVQNRNKLRLFPRKLIFTMRHRLIRLIDRFTSTHNEQKNNDLLLRFFKEKSELVQNSQDDFDQINQQQFLKFKKLNLINLHQMNYSPEQLQHCLLIRFYLDCDVNYYEKDRAK